MHVNLEAYEGPLDLLLRLIQRSEIDIYDIPIAKITAEYMEAVANLTSFSSNMEQLSEFLVMAATLLEIKSKMLLPRKKNDNEEPEEDQREALARQLIAYQQAKEIAQRLDNLTPEGEPLTGRGDRDALLFLSEEQDLDLIPLEQLNKIFADLMRRQSDKIDTVRAGYGKMPKERHRVSEKIVSIDNALRINGRLSLKFLFSECHSRNEMVVTFLAILEMVRRGMATTRQASAFEDIEVSLTKCPA